MLIEAQSNVVGSAGLQSTSAFRINTSAHAFRILSSGLYSDKIGAVLREIGCNAMDAHIAVGKPDLPFEVHLPSRLTSKFYIKDFGPGLAPDEILSLYTSYFSSSKQQSNEFTGAFGLGSKSPFSYTDSFTIVSAHGGKQYTYAAYVDQVGGPSVSLVDEQPASPDWPTGMIISLAVKQHDYYEFQQKAQQIFSWFRVTPKMVNSEQIKTRSYSVEAPEFAIPTASEYGDGVCIVMGNVRYPVPSSECGGDGWWNTVRPTLRMPIGTVDVAASRENLEFTPKTRTAIENAMACVQEHLGKELVEKVQQFDVTTLVGQRDAHAWLHPTANRWGVTQLKQFLVRGGLDANFVNVLDSLMGTYASPKVSQDFVGTVKCYFTNGRGQLKVDSIKFETSRSWARDLPGRLNDNAAVLLLGKAKYLKDRLRHALSSGNYKLLHVVSEDDVEAAAAAKAWYDFPTVKAEDLPLAPGWVRPAARPKNPRQSAISTAMGTMALIDAAAGTVRVDKDFPLESAVDSQKFYVRPQCAWGNYSYWFGRVKHSNWKQPVEHLAAIAKHVPEIPTGIGIINATDVNRYKLVDKHGWKFIGELADVLLAQSVIDKVNATMIRELSFVHDGHSYETGSPLRFLAAHAKVGSDFWLALRKRLPSSPILSEATRLSLGSSMGSVAKPIPVSVYNEALSVFGHRSSRIQEVHVQDASVTVYPTFQACLDNSFPNSLVTANFELAADVVARLIEADEIHVPATIDLLAA